jgi:hypothetical protein
VEDGNTTPFIWYIPAATAGRAYRYSLGAAYAAYWSTLDPQISCYLQDYSPALIYRTGLGVQAYTYAIKFGIICNLSYEPQPWITYNDLGNKSRPFFYPAVFASRPYNMGRIWLIWDAGYGYNYLQLLGMPKWMFMVGGGGSPYDTWSNKQYIQYNAGGTFTAGASTRYCGGLVIGPWDGSTIPLQQ